MKTKKKVVILMSTYNGEKFLAEQLDSLIKLNDDGLKIDIKIRDDGSTDKTIDILKNFSNKYNNITWFQGNNMGPAYSFLELLKGQEKYDYYAFCDQDDVWEENKIINAVKKLDNIVDKPALYFSSVNIVDKDLNFIAKGKLKMTNSFEHSFIYNPAIGCTLVINRELKDIINQANITKNDNIGMHDSWIYRVAQSINAEVIYDENAYIKYRQHENNVMGIKTNKKFFDKFEYFLTKRKRVIGDVAKEILDNYYKKLDDEKRQFLIDLYEFSQTKKLSIKFKILMNKKLRSGNVKEDFKFRYDVLFNRM